MDRDYARGFVNQSLKKEEEFLADLRAFQEKMQTVDDWESLSRDFAPRVKTFYNSQLEQWQRYYLGLDSGNMKFGFSVMHTAQKKERAGARTTIPHSVYGELKQKIKVGGTNNKLSATGGLAARDIIAKKLEQGGNIEIETRGQGGRIGGGMDAYYEDKEETSTADPPPAPKASPPPPPPPQKTETTPPPADGENPVSPTKKLTPAQLKYGGGEKPADPNLSKILQRRKDLYGSGKF